MRGETVKAFWGLYDYQWSAVSAIATAAATLVALAIPFLLKYLDARARHQELQARYYEVASAVYDAVDCITATASKAASTWHGSPDLNKDGARARSRAETLRLLARIPTLSDGAIASCFAAAEALSLISFAANGLLMAERERNAISGDERKAEALDNLNACLVLASEAALRIAEVVKHRKLTLRTGKPAPNIPKHIFG